MKIQGHSLLGERSADSANPFRCALRGLWGQLSSHLSNQRGDIDVDDEFGDGDGTQPAPKPTEAKIDDAIALAYLESQTGIKFNSLDQIKNQHSSVSGLTKKAEEAARLKKQLEAIQQATGGGQQPQGDDTPEELKQLHPDWRKLLDAYFKHMSAKQLKEFKDQFGQELRSEFRAELFKGKHENFTEHEEAFVKWLDDEGIVDNGRGNLDRAYERYLAEQQASGDAGGAPPAGNAPPTPGNNRTTRIGITPKGNTRDGGRPQVKDIDDLTATDEELEAAINQHYADRDGG
jgi:hypothetical protein